MSSQSELVDLLQCRTCLLRILNKTKEPQIAGNMNLILKDLVSSLPANLFNSTSARRDWIVFYKQQVTRAVVKKEEKREVCTVPGQSERRGKTCRKKKRLMHKFHDSNLRVPFFRSIKKTALFNGHHSAT
ncbi:hypothetical protein JHK87_048427 [Glycine soja]|nr:hypothetical protein JHK87_048427 [Glycine soja]